MTQTQRYPSEYRQIGDAIAWTAMQTGLPPSTTIAAGPGSQVGDQVLQLDPLMTDEEFPRPRLNAGGTLSFWDNSGEEELNIAAVSADGSQLTLDFAGKTYSGLQEPHLAGTRVGSNVYGWIPWDMAPMLKTDDAVFFGAALNQGIPLSIQQGGYPLYGVHLQYHRQLYRKGVDVKMDMNIWAKDELQRMWYELETYENAILANADLKQADQPAAIFKLGRLDAPASQIVLDFTLDKLQVTTDTWHYFAEATLYVTGKRRRISTL